MKEDNPSTENHEIDLTPDGTTPAGAHPETATTPAGAHPETATTPLKATPDDASGKKTTDKSGEEPSPADKAQPADTDGTMSLRTVVRPQEVDDEPLMPNNITLKKILGGDILNTQFLRRQIWVIVIASLFIIVYISNRYKCQQNLIKIDKLTNELEDAKYRALSSSSDLTQQTRESKVLERLRNDKDSTLHIAMQPPYIINIPNEEEK